MDSDDVSADLDDILLSEADIQNRLAEMAADIERLRDGKMWLR